MSLCSLPTELKLMIIEPFRLVHQQSPGSGQDAITDRDQGASTKTLACLARVSTSWHAIVIPILYTIYTSPQSKYPRYSLATPPLAVLYVSRNQDLRNFLDTVRRRPQLIGHLRKLALGDWYHTMTLAHRTEMLALIAHAPRLQHISLRSCSLGVLDASNHLVVLHWIVPSRPGFRPTYDTWFECMRSLAHLRATLQVLHLDGEAVEGFEFNQGIHLKGFEKLHSIRIQQQLLFGRRRVNAYSLKELLPVDLKRLEISVCTLPLFPALEGVLMAQCFSKLIFLAVISFWVLKPRRVWKTTFLSFRKTCSDEGVESRVINQIRQV